MPIRIQPFAPCHIPAVKDFNQRLQSGGAPPEYVFFETPEPHWLPRTNSDLIFNQLFVALDGDIVRGTYALKSQPFHVLGETRTLGFYHHPFSEGIVAREHSVVGALLLNDVMRRQPLTYCLGMGGLDRPLPRMLTALKWEVFTVPFRFRILRPFRFLRGMETLRQDPRKRYALDAAALSGLGPVAIHVLHAWKSRATLFAAPPAIDLEPSFGPWADEVWAACAAEYPLIAVRDRTALNILFPPDNPLFQRLRISLPNRGTVGWAVVAARTIPHHPQYGNLRIGQIVDVLGRQADAPAILAAAVKFLAAQRADLVTCNHTHAAWVAALDRNGFLTGPSNFIFAAPRALTAILSPFAQYRGQLYLNRADGDGLYRFV